MAVVRQAERARGIRVRRACLAICIKLPIKPDVPSARRRSPGKNRMLGDNLYSPFKKKKKKKSSGRHRFRTAVRRDNVREIKSFFFFFFYSGFPGDGESGGVGGRHWQVSAPKTFKARGQVFLSILNISSRVYKPRIYTYIETAVMEDKVGTLPLSPGSTYWKCSSYLGDKV